MNKAVAVSISLLSLINLSWPAMAQTEHAVAPIIEIERLLASDLETHRDEIIQLAQQLNQTQKQSLYTSHQKQATLNAGLNVLPGLGVGSFLQGDSGMGTTFLITDLLGITLMAIGLSSPPNSLGANLGTTGLVAFSFSKGYGLVQPFQYSQTYNTLLREALQIEQVQTAHLNLLNYQF